MGMRLLGWQRPQQQHDPAELIDFLQPRLVQPPPPGCWEARHHAADGVQTFASVSALKCIMLAQDQHCPTPEVQDLIVRWSSQRELHSVSRLPGVFCSSPGFITSHPGGQ